MHAVFLSGIDYWQRGKHARHSTAMKHTVHALMLVRLRLSASASSGGNTGAGEDGDKDADRDPGPPVGAGSVSAAGAHAQVGTPGSPHEEACLPHLPEELWLAVCSYLRSADFVS